MHWPWQGARTEALPPRVETDKVYPAHFHDDQPLLRAILLAWTFRIHDVLDPEKLHDAITRLVNLPSWMYLGGRLRQDSRGKLMIHVPQQFTAERPGVRFVHTDMGVKINDHPLAQLLPQPTPDASIHPTADHFIDLIGDQARVLRDPSLLLRSDDPQLSLYVTSFTDATLVTISLPHAQSDAMGIKEIISAMSLILAGRQDQVPTLPSPAIDVLDQMTAPNRRKDDAAGDEPYVLAAQKLGTLSLIHFGLNMALDKYLRPKLELHTICLPSPHMKRLRALAEADLPSLPGTRPPFLSDTDILTALGAHTILSVEPSRPRLPATILTVMDIRAKAQQSLLLNNNNNNNNNNGDNNNTPKALIQNMTFPSLALLTPNEVSTATIGTIAARIRLALIQQTPEPQLRAVVRESRASLASTGHNPMYGAPGARLIVSTSWEKTKMFDLLDFSPAVVPPRDGDRGGGSKEREDGGGWRVPPGRLAFHHATNLNEKEPNRHLWNFIGKDLEGNYWVSAFMVPEAWVKLRETLDGL